MKSPILWVTGSLAAATALAATLLAVTATRGNSGPELERPVAVGASTEGARQCRPSPCRAMD